MTMFDKSEEEGRQLFENIGGNQWIINEYSPVEDKLSWDVKITSGSTPVIVEIKVRKIYIRQYSEAMIELHKVNDINKLTNEQPGSVGYYAAFYSPDNKLAMWPINDYIYTGTSYCSKTTCGLNQNKIDKDMAYYPLSAATIYDY